VDLLHPSTAVETDSAAAEIEEDVILAHHQDHLSDVEDVTRTLVPDLPVVVILEDERDLILVEDAAILVEDVVILVAEAIPEV
jgi:hypothetical protein